MFWNSVCRFRHILAWQIITQFLFRFSAVFIRIPGFFTFSVGSFCVVLGTAFIASNHGFSCHVICCWPPYFMTLILPFAVFQHLLKRMFFNICLRMLSEFDLKCLKNRVRDQRRILCQIIIRNSFACHS